MRHDPLCSRAQRIVAMTAKGKKGKSKAKPAGDDSKAKPIKHNAETFNLFDKLKLDAPITTDDVQIILKSYIYIYIFIYIYT